jgi:CheY-like chemotaxis protein
MAPNNLAILAIDDNPDNLTSLQAVVADAFPEARVLTALSGRKGIELALSEDPDVILLDIVMPGMACILFTTIPESFCRESKF